MEIIFKPRIGTYMQTGLPTTIEEFSQFRTTSAIALRKEKRQKHIMHKRMNKSTTQTQNIPLEDLISQLSLTNLQSIKALRQLLCQEKFDFLRLFQIKPNIVHYLAEGLNYIKPELSFEIIWCFANLACGFPNFINDVADYMQVFQDIVINGENKFLCEQVCWVLGNLAADSKGKGEILRMNLMLQKALCNMIMDKNSKLSAVACWALCNVLRSSKPDCSVVIELGGVGILVEICQKAYCCQVVESLWLLSFITCNYDPNVLNQIYRPNILVSLSKYLNYNDNKVILPAIRALGNGFLYNQNLSPLFSDSNFSQSSLKLLTSNSFQIKKEALWMLSNLFTQDYTKSLMKYIGCELIKSLCTLVSDEIQELRTEAGISLYNLSENFSSYYLNNILEYNGPDIINAYTININTIPTWVNFGLTSSNDIDLLKCSLGFIILCLESNDYNKKTEETLFSDGLREAIEDCKFTMLKVVTKKECQESYILQQCNFILKSLKNDYDFS
ncbi:hypothetical protein SteCoe_17974 [Stentor coeruleus]|uniref:Importin subunit alpha n=1 Tax=Stentor coeruleus TaxID=5963 RepID=A0A1R2BXN5_9CILI|nr:hypothetical protein SteCoe_17974 [Stentor coeruleus]